MTEILSLGSQPFYSFIHLFILPYCMPSICIREDMKSKTLPMLKISLWLVFFLGLERILNS